jgi:hypothetical protein
VEAAPVPDEGEAVEARRGVPGRGPAPRPRPRGGVRGSSWGSAAGPEEPWWTWWSWRPAPPRASGASSPTATRRAGGVSTYGRSRVGFPPKPPPPGRPSRPEPWPPGATPSGRGERSSGWRVDGRSVGAPSGWRRSGGVRRSWWFRGAAGIAAQTGVHRNSGTARGAARRSPPLLPPPGRAPEGDRSEPVRAVPIALFEHTGLHVSGRRHHRLRDSGAPSAPTGDVTPRCPR